MIHIITSDKFLAMSNNAKLLYLMLHESLDKQYDKVIYNLDTMLKLIGALETAKKELLDYINVKWGKDDPNDYKLDGF